MQTIKKSIVLNAPAAKVWKVLLDDQFTREWYAAFSEGSHADTDWKTGSKAVFTDHSGCGMIMRVLVNKPFEEMKLEYIGQVKDSREDYDSEEAKLLHGGIESYKLFEKDGTTELVVASDMGEDYFELMSKAWDNALEKFKGLAESQPAPASL